MTPEELDRTARTLRHEWESPDLWAEIQRRIWWRRVGAIGGLIAAGILVGLLLTPVRRVSAPSASPLLTEEAMADVERTERAYRASIERLDRLAAAKLRTGKSPLLAAYGEKLRVLDSAIAQLDREMQSNDFSAHLHVQMAALYRDKQQTLEKVVRHE
ncbi:MAG: hypothetical protein FJW32_20225 [Acidobacteria bacterium]|nr:hypothetical protein [Acidobacteriota bacterium]